jgi:integrase
MSQKNVTKSPRILQVHKDRDYDCVYVGRQKIMLGKSGSPEAEAKFRRLQIQVLSDPTLAFLNPQHVKVDHLCIAYLEYVEENDPGHFSSIKTAVKILLGYYTGQPVDSLDTRHFLFLQEQFVKHGVSRKYCNALMGYIRAMLKWGAIRKLVSTQVYGEAKLIPALKEGKTKAYENPEREPVPDDVVRRTLPFMSPTVRAMVQIQRMTGMRPKEICRMTVGNIDQTRDSELWYYIPRHKTERFIGKKSIPLGKPEQELIAPYLVGKKPSEAIFSPRTAMAEWHAERRANRKTKISPSQLERDKKRAKKPAKRQPGEFYDRNSYRVAVLNAITKGNKTLPKDQQIPRWSPYQLRHANATATELEHGLDEAQAQLGHTSANMTKRNSKAQLKQREKLARNRRNPFEDSTAEE